MAKRTPHEQFQDEEATLIESIELLEKEIENVREENETHVQDGIVQQKRLVVLQELITKGAGDMTKQLEEEFEQRVAIYNEIETKTKTLKAIYDRKVAQLKTQEEQLEKLQQGTEPASKGRTSDSKDKKTDQGAKTKKRIRNKDVGKGDNTLGKAFDALNNGPDQTPPDPVDPPQPKKTPSRKKGKGPESVKEKHERFEKMNERELSAHLTAYMNEVDRELAMVRGAANYKVTHSEREALLKSIPELHTDIAKLRELLDLLATKKKDSKKQKPAKSPDPVDTNDEDAPVDPTDPDSGQDPSANVQLKNKNKKKTTDMPQNTTPEANNQPAQPEVFDIKKALNKKGFAEYLDGYQARHGGNFEQDIEGGQTEEIEKLYEAFTKSEITKKELGSIFKNEIKEDLGVSIEQADLDCIDTFITGERIHNPEEIVKLHAQVEEFRANIKIIQQKEAEITAMEAGLQQKLEATGGQEGIMNLKREVFAKEAEILRHQATEGRLTNGTTHKERLLLAKAQGKTFYERFKHRIRSRFGGGKEVVQKEIERIQAQVAELQAGVQTTRDKFEPLEAAQIKLAEIKRLKNQLGDRHLALKSIIIESADADKKIRNAVKDRMVQKMKEEVLNPADPAKRTLNQAEKQQTFLDRMRNADITGGDLSDAEIDQMQKELDAAIELEFNEEVDAALNNFKGSQNEAFSRLETSLKPFFSNERTTKLGSKEGQEARDFIIQTIEQKRDANKGAKSILLSLLLRNLKVGNN